MKDKLEEDQSNKTLRQKKSQKQRSQNCSSNPNHHSYLKNQFTPIKHRTYTQIRIVKYVTMRCNL